MSTIRLLIQVLDAAKSLLARPGNDFSWSSWNNADDAVQELDTYLQNLAEGRTPPLSTLGVLFAPTGPIQEVSLSSGWGDEFLALANRFDEAMALWDVEQARAVIERENYETALELLRPHAEAGVLEAQFLMGFLYFTSAEGTKADSLAWLERAASRDHPGALYYFACSGDQYDFCPPEDERRRRLLVRSAELGYPDAQRDLGCSYATGDYGFPKDEALGRLWYGRAAEQGHTDAQYNYGLMLLHGEGGPADPEAGLEWVRRAGRKLE